MPDLEINGYRYVTLKDNDPFDYNPAKKKVVPSSQVIPKMGTSSSMNEIETDENYYRYTRNKIVTRLQSPIELFYQVSDHLDLSKKRFVTSVLMDMAVKSAPSFFDRFNNTFENKKIGLFASQKEDGGAILSDERISDKFVDFFDFVCMQIQEDVLLVSNIDGTPRVSLCHSFAPNGWGANTVINKSFEELHSEVVFSDGKLVFPSGNKLAVKLTKSFCKLERIGAIGFYTNPILNRHPALRPPDEYNIFNPNKPELYLKFERQTITGLPEIDSFLFIVKNYVIDVFAPDKYIQNLNMLENIDKNAYYRNWLQLNVENVKNELKKRITQ
jgi:hypothetical protein